MIFECTALATFSSFFVSAISSPRFPLASLLTTGDATVHRTRADVGPLTAGGGNYHHLTKRALLSTVQRLAATTIAVSLQSSRPDRERVRSVYVRGRCGGDGPVCPVRRRGRPRESKSKSKGGRQLAVPLQC